MRTDIIRDSYTLYEKQISEQLELELAQCLKEKKGKYEVF